MLYFIKDILYFIEENIKILLVWFIVILIWSYFLYNQFFTNNIIEDKIYIKENNQKVILENKWEEIILKLNNDNIKSKNGRVVNNYDSYQAYIYPSIFYVKCISDNDDICKQLENKYDIIKTYSLWFISWDFRSSEEFKLDLDSYLVSDIDWDDLLNKLLDWVYFWDNSNNKNDLYQKYFDFKKNNIDEKIILNDLEIVCVDWIISSIIPWTFDSENIISNRVELECWWLWNISWSDIVFWTDSNTITNNLSLKVEIEELLVSYKFFTKKWLEFIEWYNQDIKVKKNIVINSKID